METRQRRAIECPPHRPLVARIRQRPSTWGGTAVPKSTGFLDGSRVVHPAIAVVQSAALAGVAAGVAAADAALQVGQVTRNDLEVALRVPRLGPGRADARASVALADGLAESPGESWARVLFVSMGLSAVEPQVVIRDVRGPVVDVVVWQGSTSSSGHGAPSSSSTAWSSTVAQTAGRH